MIFCRRSITVALVGSVALCNIAAAQTLHIKDKAETQGAQVRLGELATITGITDKQAATFARVPICASPMPGATREIGADYLVARARSFGVPVDTMKIEGAKQTRVTSRSGNVLTPEFLAFKLENYIYENMPWSRDEVEITCVPMGRPITLPAGHLEVRIEHRPGYQFVGDGVFPTSVFLDNQRVRSMYMKARVEVYHPIVVAADSIRRGSRVSADQLELRTAPLSQTGGDYFLEPDMVVGMIARRDIAPGTTITSDKVEKPILIDRGDEALLIYSAGSIEISMKVRAKTRGRMGEIVAVENPTSRKTLDAIVTGPGKVELP